MTDVVRLDSQSAPDTRANAVYSESKLVQDSRAFQFHLLVEIANFSELRRHLGCGRSEGLSADVAAHIAGKLAGLDVAVAGQALLSCWFYGSEPRDLDRKISQIRAALAAPINLDGEHHMVRASFGGAFAGSHGADEVRIVEEAEAALWEARATCGAVKHGVTSPKAAEAEALAIELDHAIDNDELILLYQPKVHVRRQEIGSAEGLVRWRHPTRGLVLPGDFIPIAEESQLIDRMTLWAIRRAIVDQRTLAAKGHDLRLFINISGQLLADPEFVREACELVGSADTKLGFEITETSVIRDPQSAIANLQLFADYGITIAIDDYGAGLSSLAYLKQLPARELKIDKLFITKLTSSHRDPLIVRSTIDLAHALEMEVVAEGVETHAALALLTVMGCDMVQGFLISRPIGLDALTTYLDEGRHQTAHMGSDLSLNGFAKSMKAR
ncbi:MAG TPA: EAL domain-containing protein [Sphingomonas sp.]|jgi:EAL domain-containing protein (putative c-di-GMP-specific phosphodiesterase class I)|nr:EAL domain-containing protein [Sphingomonas sp.]